MLERAFLAELGSGCSLPVGAYADGGRFHAFLAADDVFEPGVVPRVFTQALQLTGGEDDVELVRSLAAGAKAALGVVVTSPPARRPARRGDAPGAGLARGRAWRTPGPSSCTCR